MGVYENARKATKDKIINAFWDMYKEKPVNRITVKELSDACGIGRGTFYNHFEDVYAVLDHIEARLSLSLEKMCGEFKEKKPALNDFSRILFNYAADKQEREYLGTLVLNRRDPFFAEGYLNILKELLFDICIDGCKEFASEKDRMIVDGAISSIINLMLNCICSSALTIEETDELIIGLLQNGYYITLTNRFGIDVFYNPFSMSK